MEFYVLYESKKMKIL